MILRRIAEAVRRQDWFVVFIEIVIVVIGVYIGIYLGDIQEERKLKIEINQALQAFEDELRSDLVRLEEVIDIQTKMTSVQNEAVHLLSQKDVDEAALSPLIDFILDDNDTFFPNRSAYRTMQTEGYLAALPDEALRLQITRLVEREYGRVEFNANHYDENMQTLGLEMLPHYWSRGENRLLGDGPEVALKVQSALIHVRGMGDFYLELVTELIRPEMLKTLQMIDEYQGEGEE